MEVVTLRSSLTPKSRKAGRSGGVGESKNEK